MAAKKDQPAFENDWKLTPRQALFVVEFLKDLNQVQAAIRAGYSADTAQHNAHRLMAVDGIKQAIAAGTAKRITEVEASDENIIRELARCAFANPGLKPVEDWTEAELATVVGLEYVVKNAKAGDGITDTVLKVRRADKIRALEALAKIRAMFTEKLEVSGELATVSARLIAARKRLAERKGEE